MRIRHAASTLVALGAASACALGASMVVQDHEQDLRESELRQKGRIDPGLVGWRSRSVIVDERWLVSVDPDIPWHISAFHPDYKMLDRPPTPHTSLMRAYELGRQAGLRYVYMGNVADSERGSTRCPGCGRLLVQRDWYRVREVWRHRGVCPHCEQSIAGVWS